MNKCFSDAYNATIARLNDGAQVGFDYPAGRTAWWSYALVCTIGDEAGPIQIGAIRDYGDGLGVLHHVYRNDTWTRVMCRRDE